MVSVQDLVHRLQGLSLEVAELRQHVSNCPGAHFLEPKRRVLAGRRDGGLCWMKEKSEDEGLHLETSPGLIGSVRVS
ncbi:uncharacterized protein [Phyllobates terribilis]|uniref:uncharacterized protein isoform X3 n=1 Tax=Phyllobates terribilis TaxID=111132 RepID=UPI003CCAF47B